MGVRLYHCAPSPPSRSSLMTARAVGLDLEVKAVNLFAKEQLNDDYVKMNPQHCVPTLDDNGFILWESRAINAYLATKYGKDDTIYPGKNDAKKRAEVDRLLYFDAGTLFPRMRAIAFPALFLGETKVTQEKKDSVNEALGYMETFLGDKKFLMGNHFSIADIACAATISGFKAMGWDFSKFPATDKWLNTCEAVIPGYDENKKGAGMFANAVLSKLDAHQIP